MTTLSAFLLAYFTGIACLLVLDLAGIVYTEPMVRAVWALVRPAPYRARHRGAGRVTWAERIRIRAGTQVSRIRRAAFVRLMSDRRRPVRADVLLEPTQSLFLPVFVDEAPLCPPMYPVYDHGAGSRHYEVLKSRVLAAQASVDVTALRLRREEVSVG